MKRIKIFATIFAMGLILSISSVVPVSAANTSDKVFSFNVGYYYTTEQETESRAKDNSTSVYVKNESTFPIWIRVWGYRPVGNTKSWENETKNVYAIVPVGQYFLYNYVYENGGRLAKLGITKADNTAGLDLAKGKWSPDSVGSYPVANK